MRTYIDQDRKELAKLFKGTGVEVGVADGWYSQTIIQAGVDKLYGVDPYSPLTGYRDYTKETTFSRMYDNTVKRLQSYSNYALIKKTSMEAVKDFEDNSLDFVYIDANHDYVHCLEDIYEWFRKVKPGGILAGDDYVIKNPPEPRYDVVRAVNYYVNTEDIPELFIYQGGKTPDNWMFYKP